MNNDIEKANLKRRLKEAEAKIEMLEKIAYEDSLTSLLNRRGLEKGIENFINLTKRLGSFVKGVSVIIFDIDFFKGVNDTYGHEVGDEILVSISETLRKLSKLSLRETDLLCRWGGEEFVIVMPESHEDKAYEKAELIRKRIEQSISSSGLRVTVSLGVAEIESVVSFEDMKLRAIDRSADKALYEAKRNGRNRTVRFSEMTKK